MQIIRSVKIMQETMSKLQHKQIGFVPTMGFFHEGHTSLMKQARKNDEIVVVSIFVNPLQFGENEDFETYPRDEVRDIKIAKEHGVDYLFIPDAKEMYPSQLSISMKSVLRVHVLCGRSRPGHFDGVAVVLTKLFNIIRPNKTYFGMKDAQQVAVVDGLITDLNFDVQLIGLPTIREDSGLARSSRNVHLTDTENKEAPWLYRALKNGQQLVVDGEENPATIISEVQKTINMHTTGTIDYVELLSYPDLEPVSKVNDQIILAIAVTFSKVRLIDNIILDNGKMIQQFKQGEM